MKAIIKNLLRVEFKREPGEKPIWGVRRSMKDILYNPFLMLMYIALTPLLGIGLFALIVKYFQRRSTVYVLTNKRLFISTGVFSQTQDEIEISRIRDTKSEQTVFERLLGIGTIRIISYDHTGHIVMRSIPDPHHKRAQIREATNASYENY